jgi:hypothetical protein
MNYGHAVDLVHSDAGLSVSLRDTRPPLHAHPYTLTLTRTAGARWKRQTKQKDEVERQSMARKPYFVFLLRLFRTAEYRTRNADC